MLRLLDAYCGAGGASMGYDRAGFEVTGVDIEPMPNYPFDFHRGDAIEFIKEHGHEFDAIHASPPCQRYSAMSACRPGLAAEYPDLIEPSRAVLQASGKPWVIENVMGAPLIDPVVLCGQMFNLPLYRHRGFETSFSLEQPRHPKHIIPGGRAGHWKPGQIISVSGNCAPVALARVAMDIHWTNRRELAESIPPPYTHFVGSRLLDWIDSNG